MNTKAQVLQADSLALVEIYNAGQGATWKSATNWLTGPVNTWQYVTVADGRVTQLGINQADMGGTLSPAIGQLTELTRFEIQDALRLKGTIPTELWNCTKITRLQVKFTGITGSLPAGIEKMVNLGEINCQGTLISGNIPAELFNIPALKKAYLHESAFEGAVPATLVNATKLDRLYLQKNKLTGPLPFVNLPAANKANVELTGNFFSFADLKPYFDNKANLNRLTTDFQYAKAPENVVMEKGVPKTFTLQVTDAEGYAWFREGATVPMGIEESQEIVLNTLTDEGTYLCKAQSSMAPGCDIRAIYNLKMNIISMERDSLALVEIYNAGQGATWKSATNWLTGPVNTWQYVTVANGRVTQLGINQADMGGTLSPAIGQLTELTRFEIQDAPRLKGTIPTELWNCTKITRLQVKFTGITGSLPAGIEKMVNLGEINFQGTLVSGYIPAELFNIPALKKVYLHESAFEGAVPATLVNAKNLDRLYLQRNKLTGPLPYVNLTAPNLAKIELTGNFFTYNDVKPYHDNKATFSGLIDDYQYIQETQNVDVAAGNKASFSIEVPGGEGYAWFKDNATVPVSIEPSFEIASVTAADQGTYTCKVQSSMVANFDIRAVFNLNGGTYIPTMQKAATSADGKTITLEFDYSMANPVDQTSSFTVMVNGAVAPVTSVTLGEVNKSALVVAIDLAIPNKTVTITISYVPGEVKGSNGAKVAGFGPVAVTNNVTTSVVKIGMFSKVYPNPVVDHLVVQSGQTIVSVSLFDLTGKSVLHVTGNGQSALSIPVHELRRGVYMALIKSANGVNTHRIVKE